MTPEQIVDEAIAKCAEHTGHAGDTTFVVLDPVDTGLCRACAIALVTTFGLTTADSAE